MLSTQVSSNEKGCKRVSVREERLHENGLPLNHQIETYID